MNYKVKLTPNAIAQMQAVYTYIAEQRMEPQVALNWKNGMKNEINKLSFMPGRVQLTEEEPWHSLGIHKLSTRHFLVYFWIDENAKAVWVTAVVYEKREQIHVLIDMPLE